MTDGTGQLLQGQILAQLGFEPGGRHALGAQGGFVALGVEFAINLESLDRAYRPANCIIAGKHALLVGFEHQQALVDQVVENGLAGFRCIQQLRIVLRAELVAQAILLLAQGILELLLGNLEVADLGDNRRPYPRYSYRNQRRRRQKAR